VSGSEAACRAFIVRALERKLIAAGQGDKVGALAELVRIDPMVDTPPGDGPLRLWRMTVSFRVGEVGVALNGRDGEVMSWELPAAREGTTRDLPDQEALALATTAAELPDGAVLTFAGYEEVAGAPFFVAHWEHRHQGVVVERDFIQVLVNGKTGAICGVSRRWHTPDETPGRR